VRVLRFAARCCFELLFAAALLLVVLLGLAHFAPNSSWARERLRVELARVLALEADELRFDRLRVSWFQPVIEIEGLELGPAGRDLRIELSRVHLAWRPGAAGIASGWFGPAGVELQGGRLRITPEGLERFERLRADLEGRSKAASRTELPPLLVRGLGIVIVQDDRREFELGVLEAYATQRDGRLALTGELHSSLGLSDPATVHVEGHGDARRGFELEGWGSGLRVTRERLAPFLGTAALPFEGFGGECDLVCRARLPAAAEEPLEAEFALRLRDGHADLGAGRRIDAARIGLELVARARDQEALWTNEAWRGRLDASARFQGTPFELTAELGPRDAGNALLRADLHVPDLPLEVALLEALGVLKYVERDWNALEPSGSCALRARIELPRREGPDGLATALRAAEVSALIDCAGRAGLRFRGWVEHDGVRRGFPLPADEARGRLLYVRAPTSARAERVGLLDLQARVRDGGERPLVRCRGLIGSPDPLAPRDREGRLRPELDLEFSLAGLRLGPELEQALAGAPETAFVWPQFRPSAGSLVVSWRVVQNRELEGLAASGDIDVFGASARWSALPVDLHELDGRLRLRFAQRPHALRDNEDRARWVRPVGVAFDLAGKTETDKRARISGVVRGETPPEGVVLARGAHAQSQWIEVALERLSWKGQEVSALSQWEAEIGQRIGAFGPSGHVDARWGGGRMSPAAPYRWDLELELQPGASVYPQALQSNVKQVEGRVCVSSRELDEAPRPELGFGLALKGDWAGARVAVAARAEAGLPAELHFHAAGVDPANASVLGTLSMLGSDGERGVERGSLELKGRLDLHGKLRIDLDAADEPSPSVTAWPRDLSMGWGSFQLAEVEGSVTYSSEVLRADRLRARMAGTPVVLRDVRLFPQRALEPGSHEAQRLSEVRVPEGSTVFLADLGALELPLDREHLAAMFGEAGLANLARFELGGTLQAEGVRLVVFGDAARGGSVHAAGRLALDDFRASVGMPIEIERGQVDLESLVIERGRVRGWARLTEGSGALAGREFEDASMVASFVDGRLNIDDLSSGFQQGTLRSLGGERGNAFALDLAEPYHFSLALELSRVQLKGLLQGVFDSAIADSGSCDARLRLSGSFSDLQDMQGSGTLELLDTRLWSIPVVRNLFSQVGMDSSATFQEIRTRFELRDGEIRMKPIVVTSPLLRLEGSGRLGLDGRLRHDFEVRYSVVDRMGPFTRLLYWIQNNLLRVAVRGDIARPVVILRGTFLDLFRERDSLERHLPLPAFAPLPARF